MNHHFDDETWLVNAGDAVVAKKAGGARLSPAERLVYCLWVADYGMRNAGDLDTARDLHHDFQREAAHLAGELRLRFTRESFALSAEALQAEYFERFDRICREIRTAF
jgi:hypothetical protein